MKTQRIPVMCVLAGVLMTGIPLAGALRAAETKAAGNARVEIVFDHPEKFTDIKDSSMDTEKGRESVMAELREYLEERAVKFLPAGQRLSITFTDIDLAGDYEPWRVGTNTDVRVVKDIYPPRFEFSYKITDASGVVVKEGKENLRDMAFMGRLVISRNDPYRYEKDMMSDWLRTTLPKSSK